MKPRNWWNIQNISEDADKSPTTLFLKDVYNILSKGFTLNDNAKGAILTMTFVAGNEDLKVRHGLDFVPTNYIVCGTDAQMTIYDGSIANDKTFAYLRSSAIGTARIFLF